MKKTLFISVVILLFLFAPVCLLAQDPGGGPDVPIDGGLSLLLAAGAAWIIGKTALGLRSDYLAIATLGIAEIIIAVMKNEDWLSRGVKNVVGLKRPTGVPYEIDLQSSASFIEKAAGLGLDPATASSRSWRR